MKQFLSLRHSMLVILALFGLVSMSSTALARDDDYYYGNNNRSVQIAINNGYQLGYGQGSNDRTYGRRFDVDDSKTFRDADSGYSNSGFRNKDEYRRLFRQGFEIGYRDGYSGYQRRGNYNSGYSNPVYNNPGSYNYPVRNRDYNPPRGHAYGHERGRGNPHRNDRCD